MGLSVTELLAENRRLKTKLKRSDEALRRLLTIVHKTTVSFQKDLNTIIPEANECIDETKIEFQP